VQKVIVTQTDRDFVDLSIKKLTTKLGKAAEGLALAAAPARPQRPTRSP